MKIQISILSALLILFLAACSGPFNPPNAGNDGLGMLTVQIGSGGDERTLAPSAEAFAGFSYKLLIRSSNTVAFDGAFTGTANTYQLKPGGYEVIAEAYNGNDLVARVSRSVTIIAEGSQRLNLVLVPLHNTDVSGTFTYKIEFPDAEDKDNAIDYYTATVYLTPDYTLNTGMVILDMLAYPELKSGSLKLPPGCYTMEIDITSTRQIYYSNSPYYTTLSVKRIEVVYIYPNLTTNALFGFGLEDFTADVYFSGTAEIWNTDDYTPVKVYASKESSSFIPELEADIVFNEDTGEYEWELFIDSAHQGPGTLSQMYFRFVAEHADNPAKTIISGNHNVSLSDKFGRSGIQLYIDGINTLDLGSALPAGITADFVNNEVARGGWAQVVISLPAKYGLLAREVWTNYSGYVGGAATFDYEGGNVILGIPTTTSWSADEELYLYFFELAGTVTVDPADENGYAPVKIEAYEPGDEGDTLIAAVVPALVDSVYTWEIPLAGYAWRSGSNAVILKTTLAAEGIPNYVDTAIGSIFGANDLFITPILDPNVIPLGAFTWVNNANQQGWRSNGTDDVVTALEWEVIQGATYLVIKSTNLPSQWGIGGLQICFQGDGTGGAWASPNVKGGWDNFTNTPADVIYTVIKLADVSGWAGFISGTQGKFLIGELNNIGGASGFQGAWIVNNDLITGKPAEALNIYNNGYIVKADYWPFNF